MLRSRLVTASLLALSLAVASTACTVPVQVDNESAAVAAAKSLPFAYDTAVDQIAHMSCSNMPMSTSLAYNTSAYFSYRVGAYGSGGIMLKDEFFQALKNKKQNSQAEILSASAANKDTILQVAIRSRTDYQTVYTRSGSATLDQDYANMFTALGTDDISNLLISQPAGTRVKFARSGLAGGLRMEGSLRATESSTLVQATRDFLQGRGNSQGSSAGLLAVTYTNGGTIAARSIAHVDEGATVTANQSVFGRGYVMTFAQPSVSPRYSLYPENVISSIGEQNLARGSTDAVGTWSCPTSMQLRIVRDEDVKANKSGANCVKKPDPLILSNELKVLRNVLKVEDWYIDLDRRCIVPKVTGPGCYGAVTDVKYNMGDACGVVDASGASNCVQYASVCYRN